MLEAMGVKPIPLFMLSAWIKAGAKCGFNVQPLFKEAGIKIDLIRLEDALVRRAALLGESLLRQATTGAAHAFDPEVVHRHLGSTVELASTLNAKQGG
mgnify:CR=1 FL=1